MHAAPNIRVCVCNMDDETDMYEHGQGEEF